MDAVITWLVRSIHILGAAVWLGGYVVMLLVVVPALARDRSDSMRALAITACRVLSFSGMLTVLAGLVLIAQSRGYAFLFVGEWGGIIVTSAVLAIILGALGDVALKPAIRRLKPETTDGQGAVRRWTIVGLAIGLVILLLMTRTIYART